MTPLSPLLRIYQGVPLTGMITGLLHGAAVRVGVSVGVKVGVKLGVNVGVNVTVGVNVSVNVGDSVTVGVSVGVGVAVKSVRFQEILQGVNALSHIIILRVPLTNTGTGVPLPVVVSFTISQSTSPSILFINVPVSMVNTYIPAMASSIEYIFPPGCIVSVAIASGVCAAGRGVASGHAAPKHAPDKATNTERAISVINPSLVCKFISYPPTRVTVVVIPISGVPSLNQIQTHPDSVTSNSKLRPRAISAL